MHRCMCPQEKTHANMQGGAVATNVYMCVHTLVKTFSVRFCLHQSILFFKGSCFFFYEINLRRK